LTTDLQAEGLASYDLVIITENSTVVPKTSTLWLGSVPESMAVGAAATTAVGGLAADAHVLVADVDASTLSVRQAQPLVLPEGAEPLLSAGGAVLAWARTTTFGRQVMVGFGLSDSDWASKVGFPTFVAALVEWVAPRETRSTQSCSVGRTCPLPLEAAFDGAKLIDPDGEQVESLAQPRLIEYDQLAE